MTLPPVVAAVACSISRSTALASFCTFLNFILISFYYKYFTCLPLYLSLLPLYPSPSLSWPACCTVHRGHSVRFCARIFVGFVDFSFTGKLVRVATSTAPSTALPRDAAGCEDIVWSQGSSCLPGVCPGMCEVIGAAHTHTERERERQKERGREGERPAQTCTDARKLHLNAKSSRGELQLLHF